LAKNDLIATHPIEVELIMQLWTKRLNALLRLKHYEIAEAEIKSLKIGNTREFHFNQYPEIFPDKSGAMLSFEFLMVINSLPSLKGLHNESINNYYKMLNPQNIWDFRPDEGQHRKIVIRIIHALSKIPDIPLAIDLLKNTLIPHQDSASLQAWLGRLQLQLGQLNIAQSTFSKVSSTIIQIEHSIGLSSNIPLGIFEEFLDDLMFPELIYTNRGLLNFSAGHHEVAIKYFSTLLSVKPDLYSGNVSQASSFLESFIVSNPKVAVLNAEMVSNLVSMYDLTDSSSIKKKALLKVIIQDCGDDFEPDCMKL
jgi:trafficking protein particle complex subunit 12